MDADQQRSGIHGKGGTIHGMGGTRMKTLNSTGNKCV